MRYFIRSNLVWFLAALFLFSAGHGVFFHADHEDANERQDCALCVLAWTAAIAVSSVFSVASPRPFVWFGHGRDIVCERAPAHSHSQRAPPIQFLP